jgi:hypothetical protein
MAKAKPPKKEPSKGKEKPVAKGKGKISTQKSKGKSK